LCWPSLQASSDVAMKRYPSSTTRPESFSDSTRMNDVGTTRIQPCRWLSTPLYAISQQEILFRSRSLYKSKSLPSCANKQAKVQEVEQDSTGVGEGAGT
jgi:hypothetical protein